MNARRRIVNNQQGFTLIEIIAVLVLLGILAAVAVPKYMDLTDTARQKAAQGQISEVKGRLSSGLNGYMLANSGTKPSPADLLTCLNGGAVTLPAICPSGGAAGTCPTGVTTEGDFEFVCAASGANAVTITVSKVQNVTLLTPVTGTFTIQ